MMASRLNPGYDSVFYEIAEMNCFVFKDYDEAIKNFDKLLAINSNFADGYLGRAYCFQQLGENQLAVDDFQSFIFLNDNEGMAFYLKAISELSLQKPIAACKDLQKAEALGIKEAEKLILSLCKE